MILLINCQMTSETTGARATNISPSGDTALTVLKDFPFFKRRSGVLTISLNWLMVFSVNCPCNVKNSPFSKRLSSPKTTSHDRSPSNKVSASIAPKTSASPVSFGISCGSKKINTCPEPDCLDILAYCVFVAIEAACFRKVSSNFSKAPSPPPITRNSSTNPYLTTRSNLSIAL